MHTTILTCTLDLLTTHFNYISKVVKCERNKHMFMNRPLLMIYDRWYKKMSQSINESCNTYNALLYMITTVVKHQRPGVGIRRASVNVTSPRG